LYTFNIEGYKAYFDVYFIVRVLNEKEKEGMKQVFGKL
jgi:hypothetical protein